MRIRTIQAVLIFVLGTVVGAAGIGWAQGQRAGLGANGQQPSYTMTTDTAGNIISTSSTSRVEPTTLSNEALGLRVEGKHHGRVVGTLVAKINGEWIEVQFASQNSLAGR